jgi:hypothetical protein
MAKLNGGLFIMASRCDHAGVQAGKERSEPVEESVESLTIAWVILAFGTKPNLGHQGRHLVQGPKVERGPEELPADLDRGGHPISQAGERVILSVGAWHGQVVGGPQHRHAPGADQREGMQQSWGDHADGAFRRRHDREAEFDPAEPAGKLC